MNQAENNEIQSTILIVDDDPVNVDVLYQTLEPTEQTQELPSTGYEILVATSGEMALKIARNTLPDLILLDVLLPGMNGFEICQKLKQDESTSDIPVIFITIKDQAEEIVKGFQAGGVDYIVKPFQKEVVLARVKTHLNNSRLMRELIQKNKDLEQEIAQRKALKSERNHLRGHLSMISRREAEHWGIASIVGKSRTIQKILEKINSLQTTKTTSVLIIGESGTGKELIARAIHFESPRAEEPFVPVNCSAIPSRLAESLLFGHIQGAFTGATADQEGYFALADGGTLFLDEIGYMSVEIQAKLLRVLEDGFVMPVGATDGKSVDVRVLAAASSSLEPKMEEGEFLPELYFRLARFSIDVPPLREHKEDIPLLTEHFLKLFATEMGKDVPSLSSDALSVLESYDFPGNVRELKNIIEHALIESGGAEIQPEHLHFVRIGADAAADSESEIPLNLKEAEVFVIERALAKTNGNISEAARLLGTNRMKIYRALARKE